MVFRWLRKSDNRGDSPEEKFWCWFQDNEDRLFNLEPDQQELIQELLTVLNAVHPDLTFEVSVSPKNNKRDFVISANGLKDVFPVVESLYALAPAFERWKIIKFRPRHEPMDLRIGDLSINTDDIEITMEADGNKVGLTVYIYGFEKSKEDLFTHAAFLMLDQALGEYDMETKVGFVEVRPFDALTRLNRIDFMSLPVVFDAFMNH